MKRKSKDFTSLLLWYFLLGALHELSHVLATALLAEQSIEWSSWPVIARLFLARQTPWPNQESASNNMIMMMIRHTGWLTSLLLAYLLRNSRSSSIRLAAFLTACEALCTDLLGLPVIPFLPTTKAFYCGNFGIILLHQAWLRGDAALDVLEKLVQVTMMRGAQSGGTYFQRGANYRRLSLTKIHLLPSTRQAS
jgi:hypothetical protein